MPEPDGEIVVGKFRIRGVPRWVIVFVILCAVAAACIYGYRWLNSGELISARHANELLKRSVLEYGRHIAEDPEIAAVLMDDSRGKLTAKRYSDDCIILARKHPNGRTHSKLVVHFEGDDDTLPRARRSIEDVVMDATQVLAASRPPSCLNPHPGRFETWYGDRNGCWIDVWRRWPDGCQHVQGYNSCHNVWDSHPDGSARVKWTHCSH